MTALYWREIAARLGYFRNGELWVWSVSFIVAVTTFWREGSNAGGFGSEIGKHVWLSLTKKVRDCGIKLMVREYSAISSLYGALNLRWIRPNTRTQSMPCDSNRVSNENEKIDVWARSFPAIQSSPCGWVLDLLVNRRPSNSTLPPPISVHVIEAVQLRSDQQFSWEVFDLTLRVLCQCRIISDSRTTRSTT